MAKQTNQLIFFALIILGLILGALFLYQLHSSIDVPLETENYLFAIETRDEGEGIQLRDFQIYYNFDTKLKISAMMLAGTIIASISFAIGIINEQARPAALLVALAGIGLVGYAKYKQSEFYYNREEPRKGLILDPTVSNLNSALGIKSPCNKITILLL